MYVATVLVEVVPIYRLQGVLQTHEIDHEVIETGASPIPDPSRMAKRKDPSLIALLGSGGERPVGPNPDHLQAPSDFRGLQRHHQSPDPLRFDGDAQCDVSRAPHAKPTTGGRSVRCLTVCDGLNTESSEAES